MRAVDIARDPTGPDRDSLTRFIERRTGEIGSRPFSDHLWLALTAQRPRGLLTVSVRERAPADPEPTTIAVAVIAPAHEGSVLEVDIAHQVPDRHAVLIDIADTALDAFRRDGGGQLTWWTDDADDALVDLAASHGLVAGRRLHELRRTLPLGDRATIVTRSFEPGVDDEAWLGVNNRAFAGHGEQGGWTLATLHLRMAEPWFDPDGFRIHEDGGRLAGFCWTKIHDERGDRVGEIYVIGVDPHHHGRGLGRQLTLAGLDWLADQGLTSAMLFVDADNVAAIGLYRRLGFEPRRTRTALAGTLGQRTSLTGAR